MGWNHQLDPINKDPTSQRTQKADKKQNNSMPTNLQGGPLPITNEIITPINGHGFISYNL